MTSRIWVGLVKNHNRQRTIHLFETSNSRLPFQLIVNLRVHLNWCSSNPYTSTTVSLILSMQVVEAVNEDIMWNIKSECDVQLGSARVFHGQCTHTQWYNGRYEVTIQPDDHYTITCTTLIHSLKSHITNYTLHICI